MKLLTREQFFETVMRRDGKWCVYCGEPAVDAHHLIDRKCFADGGYYEDNGVSLCSKCHLYAEQGLLSPQQLRNWAGIDEVVLPEGFDTNLEYDKWGKPVVIEENPVDQCMVPIKSLKIDRHFETEILAKFIVDCGLKEEFIEFAKQWAKNPSLVYDPEYGDDKECLCGHAYYRHFDSYEDMSPVGCKYCRCYTFVLAPTQSGR